MEMQVYPEEDDEDGSEPSSPRSPKSPKSPQSPGLRASQQCRVGLCTRLRETPFLDHEGPLFMHGRGYCGPMRPPVKTWECEQHPGDGSSSKWLTASEFEDLPEVAAAKARQLAALMRLSRKTVLYTGTGIAASVATALY